MTTVPRLWPGETVVILAGGPSLLVEDVEACRGQHLIAVKDTIRLAPWADVLYACDAKWWRAHPETEAFTGPKYGLEPPRGRTDVQVLRHTGDEGLELDPTAVRTYRNSGGQAINLAVHLGAARILLLGFDMQPNAKGDHHWFGWHPYGRITPPYVLFLRHLATIVEPLKHAGVQVINCSRRTALTIFPRMPLRDALAAPVSA